MAADVDLIRAERALDRFSSRPLRVRGVRGCARLLGAAAVIVHLSDYGPRSYLFGPDAAMPVDQATSQLPWTHVSIYALTDSPIYFETLFHVGLLAGAALLAWPRRWLVALTWVLLTGLQARNPFLLDGGDTLLRVGLLYLLLADLRLPPTDDPSERVAPSGSRMALHNAAVILLVGQLMITYLLSAASKALSPDWRGGDAIGLIFGLDQFNRFSGPTFGPELELALAWAVIFVEVLIPLGLLLRPTRPLAVAAAVVLHGTIAVVMGLTTFSLTMLAFVAVTIPDDAWPAGRRSMKRTDPSTVSCDRSVGLPGLGQPVPVGRRSGSPSP